MPRILSGIQPSGQPHLGNFLGAMQRHVKNQDQNESFIFLANYHALTTIRDSQKLRDLTRELAIDYLAIGLDPNKITLFRQSDLPEHTELAWIFSCLTSLGLLERCHAWKDAMAKGKKDPSVGLFTYPVLMAADILIYKPNFVPVGKDQKQHVEVARDIAERFNYLYKETFPLPEPDITVEIETIIGTDGEKMSKSYNNTISLFGSDEQLEKEVLSIKTDSTPLEDSKNPKTCNVFKLYSYFANDDEISDLRDKYLTGGFGYGDAKKLLLKKLHTVLDPYREKRVEIAGKLDYVEEVLLDGARRARKVARKTLDEVRVKVGLQ
ncbi:MAG: tryptophanyl-tRNA synthetase, tryptophanyl-tRNA synthetase [Candidatus Peregrinibacteria bacterium GW2011_GWF2_39_17]|nr:MAG: tryptophanyl-tRNA synthetase, tryptophanyl-tRNA synthetase [Candidatus Peregrinibacteria bacterium GW2011_GWF2_39_17]HCW32258.1 tryptophan--tRNA ligase [Candidatus Peregrinibacteria bacterium]